MATDSQFLDDHAKIWEKKPRLRASYARYYEKLFDACPKDGRVLELGCALGTLGQAARERGYRRWIASDILAGSRASLRCDAMRLPFATGSLDRIVFIDVLHHLGAPKRFFKEAARALAPGGEIVAVEPWVTPFSWPVYRFVHHEGCDLSRDPEAPFGGAGSKPAFEGDCGLTTVVCKKIDARGWRELGFEAPEIETFTDFAYLATRGFQPGPDAPGPVYSFGRACDAMLAPLSGLFGLRARVRWKRAAASALEAQRA